MVAGERRWPAAPKPHGHGTSSHRTADASAAPTRPKEFGLPLGLRKRATARARAVRRDERNSSVLPSSYQAGALAAVLAGGTETHPHRTGRRYERRPSAWQARGVRDGHDSARGRRPRG